jgi:nucleotide-binding universal stress UspA family protein
MTARAPRIVVASDGSPAAARAVALAASLPWPGGTVIEALRVDEPLAVDLELPPDAYEALQAEIRRETDEQLALVSGQLAAPGRQVRTVAVSGRPASAIVALAEHAHADLVIVGSRGRGPLASMLLGSVAAEVVDHAPCPVLVARSERVQRLLVADDGSLDSSGAMHVVATWPIFQGMTTRVVSVAPSLDGEAPAGASRHPAASKAFAETVDALRSMHRLIADGTAGRLSDAGVPARAEIRMGDVAEQIIDAALESDADLIVLGSHGRTGLERVLLGSVARNVLHHAPCSVLIVRAQVAARIA